MTNKPQFLEFHPHPNTPTESSSDIVARVEPPASPSDENSYTNKGNGKVAQLPKAIRDQVNRMMADGLSYPEIIRRLGDHGKGLKPGHLCEHRKRAYKEWLHDQEWL